MITTLSLDQFTRPLWGEHHAWVMAHWSPWLTIRATSRNGTWLPIRRKQLVQRYAGLPPVGENGSYVQYGLQITPGSIIVGNLLYSTEPVNFLFKMRDVTWGTISGTIRYRLTSSRMPRGTCQIFGSLLTR